MPHSPYSALAKAGRKGSEKQVVSARTAARVRSGFTRMESSGWVGSPDGGLARTIPLRRAASRPARWRMMSRLREAWFQVRAVTRLFLPHPYGRETAKWWRGILPPPYRGGEPLREAKGK